VFHCSHTPCWSVNLALKRERHRKAPLSGSSECCSRGGERESERGDWPSERVSVASVKVASGSGTKCTAVGIGVRSGTVE